MPSLSDIINALKSIVILVEDLKRVDAEVKDIRREMRDLTIIVYALAQDIKNSKEKAEQRHENLLLELENRLLKYDKSLPPAPAAKKKASKKGAKKRA